MNTVVIVGIGELVQHVPKNLKAALSPLDLMEKATRLALEDTGVNGLASKVDTLAVVRTFSDSGAPLKSPFGDPINPPRSIAKRLGVNPETAIYGELGGHTPQSFINEFSTKIASGFSEVVMLVGAEALANQKALRRAKMKVDWTDDTDGLVENRLGNSITNTIDIEQFPNEFLNTPAIYSVFENARRARLNLNRDDYTRHCANLFSRFSEVAAKHPHSMFQESFDAANICTISSDNYSVSDIYNRSMVAKDGVNQGAALIMMSEAKARQFGIAPERWVYPVAGSEATDLTIVHREDISRSLAMEVTYEAVLEAANLSMDEITCMDIYSCFPIAVFAACEAMGIDIHDPRGLTLTGGLPFFGGPGNNYAMHSIVNVVKRLRADSEGIGLVGSNGGYLSKHAIGIYASTPPQKGWCEADKSALALKVNRQSSPDIATYADGRARIEGYSVEYTAKGPKRGFVIGRLMDNRRFIGVTDRNDIETLETMLQSDPFDKDIFVTSKGPGNRFTFEANKTRALAPVLPKTLEGEYEFCNVIRNDRILEITINRPEARNSLTPEANYELEHIFNLFEKDRSLWVAILTGAGQKAFSAGNDLKYSASGKPFWIPETGFGGLTHRRNRSKPVIAAVNGFAYGGGLEIALACDIIVADETAKFALPEVKTGLVAAAGGLFRLPTVLPPHIARDMILTGRPMEIKEALQYGLANYKTKAGKTMEKAREIAESICQASPTAISTSIEMMHESANILNPIDAVEYSTNKILRVMASEDLQIGLLAFIMKQPAKWKNR